MFIFKSITTKNLSNKNIKDICRLKDSYWNYGLISQLNYFKKNIKRDDIHNCYFFGDKLIGYTLLKKATCTMNKIKINFLHFDTLVININFQNKKIGSKLMSFNNKIIKQSKLISFLICNKEMIRFYKKNFWKIANKNYKKINIYKMGLELMVFNEDQVK